MKTRARLVLLLVALLAVATALVFGLGGCGTGCKSTGHTCALNEQCCSLNCDREALGTCACAALGHRCSETSGCCTGGQCTNGICEYHLN